MSNRLGVSGSTILSEKELFTELLSYGTEHIEIGEFANMDEYNLMMDMIESNDLSFGIHSPIMRGSPSMTW